LKLWTISDSIQKNTLKKEDDFENWRNNDSFNHNFVIPYSDAEYVAAKVNNDGNVELHYISYDHDYLTSIVIPKEVFINENIDEWCKSAVLERKHELKESIERAQAEKEESERKLYEELKKKYGDS